MAEWFGAHYNQEVRFISEVKGPQVLTSLLNQRRNYFINITDGIFQFSLHLLMVESYYPR